MGQKIESHLQLTAVAQATAKAFREMEREDRERRDQAGRRARNARAVIDGDVPLGVTRMRT